MAQKNNNLMIFSLILIILVLGSLLFFFMRKKTPLPKPKLRLRPKTKKVPKISKDRLIPTPFKPSPTGINGNISEIISLPSQPIPPSPPVDDKIRISPPQPSQPIISPSSLDIPIISPPQPSQPIISPSFLDIPIISPPQPSQPIIPPSSLDIPIISPPQPSQQSIIPPSPLDIPIISPPQPQILTPPTRPVPVLPSQIRRKNPPMGSLNLINLSNNNTNCFNQDFDLYFSQKKKDCAKREPCPKDKYFNWLKEDCTSKANVKYYSRTKDPLPSQIIEDEFAIQEALKETRVYEPYMDKSKQSSCSYAFTAKD